MLQTVTLTATASEDGGTIRKVGFYSNGKLLVERTAAPYTYTYTPAVGGTLNFSAVATDTKNATATSSTIAVTVNAPIVSALKVSLTTSTTYTLVPATVTLPLGEVVEDARLSDLLSDTVVPIDDRGRAEVEVAAYGYRWFRIVDPRDRRLT